MSFSLNQLFFFSIPIKHKLHFKTIHLRDEHNLIRKVLKPKCSPLVLCPWLLGNTAGRRESLKKQVLLSGCTSCRCSVQDPRARIHGYLIC